MDSAEETAGGHRPWSEVTPDAARRLLVAAVEAFAERGYHATTTRDIGMLWSGALLVAAFALGYFTPPIYATRAV
ncbi:TetR family transcriptional regulator, partial [Streptomyces sp. NPDC001193]